MKAYTNYYNILPYMYGGTPLGTRLATASAAAVAMALANAAYARTALGRYNCFEKSILCYIDRMFSILGKRKFTIS